MTLGTPTPEDTPVHTSAEELPRGPQMSLSGVITLSPGRFAASPHNGIKSLKMAKLGFKVACRSWKRTVERQERGRKEVHRMGKFPSTAEGGDPAVLSPQGHPFTPQTTQPNGFFGWVSRDGFRMSPWKPHRISYTGLVPAAGGEGRDGHIPQTLGSQTCPHRSLLFYSPLLPAATQII